MSTAATAMPPRQTGRRRAAAGSSPGRGGPAGPARRTASVQRIRCGEDLPRPGGLQRVEVQREEAPDQRRREALEGTAPLLVERSLVDRRRPGRAGVGHGVGARPTIQESRPASSSAMSGSVGGPPARVDACRRSARGRGRRRSAARRRGRCPSGREPWCGVVETGQRERQRRVVGVGVVAHDPGRVGLVARDGRRGCRRRGGPRPTCRWRSPRRGRGGGCGPRASERSLSTSKTPSLKIGQFW